ncbi:MAG: membrane dipeptidase [Anaerolineales bacterium]|nr:membrane dipeptidase [Anaerolineales bacterium]
MLIVDGHEDIAWNMQQFKRDYLRSAAETRAIEAGSNVPEQNGNTLLGWPDWLKGQVAVVFATLFAVPQRHITGPWETVFYKDQDEAACLYWEQLDLYHRWAEENPEKFRLIGSRKDLAEVLASWSKDPLEPLIGLVPLMEGADAVLKPDRLVEWYEQGLRIVGLAWSGTAYAGGTREPGPISPAGFDLMDIMADLGLVLDISHLSEEGCLQALDHYPGTVIASHGNPAALISNSDTPERHFTDEVIRRLAERGGVVGVTIYNRFLRGDWKRKDGRQEFSLDNVAEHIDYICQKTGSAVYVGLGSDFDGGLGVEDTPADLDTVADLQLIGNRLEGRGFSSQDIEAVLGKNWLNLLEQSLPEK